MELPEFFHSYFFHYFAIPLLIFLSRIIDVSLGTMRVIFISKGFKLFAAVCGFFEVFIWLIAITQILKNLDNFYNYIAYAAGFAAGNYVGMFIEEKIALGTVLIRVVTRNEVVDLMEYLKSKNYGVTVLDAKGLHGNVKILFSIIPRKRLAPVVTFIKNLNPQAFYTIEDIRFVNEMRLSPRNTAVSLKRIFSFKRPFRKGK